MDLRNLLRKNLFDVESRTRLHLVVCFAEGCTFRAQGFDDGGELTDFCRTTGKVMNWVRRFQPLEPVVGETLRLTRLVHVPYLLRALWEMWIAEGYVVARGKFLHRI